MEERLAENLRAESGVIRRLEQQIAALRRELTGENSVRENKPNHSSHVHEDYSQEVRQGLFLEHDRGSREKLLLQVWKRCQAAESSPSKEERGTERKSRSTTSTRKKLSRENAYCGGGGGLPSDSPPPPPYYPDKTAHSRHRSVPRLTSRSHAFESNPNFDPWARQPEIKVEPPPAKFTSERRRNNNRDQFEASDSSEGLPLRSSDFSQQWNATERANFGQQFSPIMQNYPAPASPPPPPVPPPRDYPVNRRHSVHQVEDGDDLESRLERLNAKMDKVASRSRNLLHRNSHFDDNSRGLHDHVYQLQHGMTHFTTRR